MDKIRELEQWVEKGYSLVIIQNDKIVFKSKEAGIKALYKLIKKAPDKLKGALVFDKIVGRAAALLLVLGQVREVVAWRLSQPGKNVLVKYQIRFSAQQMVENILAEDGRGVCPFERLAEGKEPKEFYQLLLDKFK